MPRDEHGTYMARCADGCVWPRDVIPRSAVCRRWVSVGALAAATVSVTPLGLESGGEPC